MSVLFLTESDVCQLITVGESVDILQRAFESLHNASAVNVPRMRAKTSSCMLHTMSAGAEYLGLVGCKVYTTTRQQAQFHVLVHDAETGTLRAIIEADHLGRMRTGAASGLATRLMANPNSRRLGIFGCGRQARTQLLAIASVLPIESASVFSRREPSRSQFAAQMSHELGFPVRAVARPEDATVDHDVIACATTSRSPVFEGRHLSPGTHLNVAGSNFLAKSEIDVETVRRSDLIVCDSVEQCRVEAGDFRESIDAGVFRWENATELAEVAVKGCERPSDSITLFKSVGLAIEDVAMAAELIDRARREGCGTSLPLDTPRP